MTDTIETDVLIVGAGPAGCAAAVRLTERSHVVHMIDKAAFPRDKTCGDGLTTNALRKLEEIGLSPDAVPSWNPVDDVTVLAPGGTRVDFELPRSRGHFAVIARRMDLDNALVARAAEAGATLHQNAELEAVTQTGDAVEAVTSKGRFRARYLVAADGMFSPTRKMCGLSKGPQLGNWHAFRQYFECVDGPGSDSLFVSFEHDLLPGYFWCFPLGDGRANVGFGIERGRRYSTRDMKHLWVDLLARPHIAELLGPDARPVDSHRAWPIPAAVDGATPSSGRVLFVGDALAACDPMSGEGIGQALQSGLAAADAISNHIDDPFAAAEYTEHVSSELVPDHRMSALLVKALQHRRGASWALRVAGTNAWTRRNFARWLFEDYPRAVLFTPKRWHRRVFTSDGAYN